MKKPVARKPAVRKSKSEPVAEAPVVEHVIDLSLPVSEEDRAIMMGELESFIGDIENSIYGQDEAESSGTPVAREIAVMPTIGRMVLLRGRDAGAPEPEGLAGLDMPAIVTHVVTPEILHLTVFACGQAPNPSWRVEMGDKAGQWYWPPR